MNHPNCNHDAYDSNDDEKFDKGKDSEFHINKFSVRNNKSFP